MAANSNFESPILEIAHLVSSMKELHNSFSETDLKNPDPRRWMDIYSCIFLEATARPIENAVQCLVDYGIFKVEYKDLYEEGLNQMAFTLCMKRMFDSCGVTDFSLQDDIQPRCKRLIRFLSAFFNKRRHDVAMTDSFNRIDAQCMEAKLKHDKIISDHAEYKHRWESMKQSEGQIEEQMSKLNEVNEEQIAQMVECIRQREQEQKSLEEIKLKMSEKTALKEKYKIAIQEMQQEIEKLSQKIVQSPDTLRQDLERLKKRKEELHSSLESKYKQKSQAKVVNEQTVNNKVISEKACKLAQEILLDLEKAKGIASETEQHNERLQELQYEMTALCTQFDDINENIAVRQNKKHTLTQQIDIRKQCGEQQKEDVERNVAFYQEKLDNIKDQHDQINKKVALYRQSISRLEGHCEKEDKKWNAQLEEIYQQLDILHNKYADAIKKGCQKQ